MPIGFALAETGRTRKLYGASTGAHQFQRSSVVERSAVNRLVVGSNPTAGARLGHARQINTPAAFLLRC